MSTVTEQTPAQAWKTELKLLIENLRVAPQLKHAGKRKKCLKAKHI